MTSSFFVSRELNIIQPTQATRSQNQQYYLRVGRSKELEQAAVLMRQDPYGASRIHEFLPFRPAHVIHGFFELGPVWAFFVLV